MWAWLVAAAVFLVSIPAMWWVGQLAIFAYGFGLWIVPWFLGAMFGGAVFPQGSYAFVPSEFDGPIIGFAFLAAVQNALIFLLLVKLGASANRAGQRAQEEAAPR